MRPLLLVGSLLVATTALTLRAQAPDPYAGQIAQTPPRSPADEKKLLRLPPGFEAQLVASEPDIYKPMNLAFDDRGRLWVTSSIEYPYPAARPRDRITVLEDFGPDGKARKVTQFASDLNIPIGLLPLPGGGREALAFSIPRILRLKDTDGDGRADQREVFLSTFGQIDTHGLTSGFTHHFDGWIYACHGFNNTSELRGKDGSFTLNSGNTYRIRPDGSRLEWFTHGQVNPFGMTVDPFGNLYTADCHSRPVYQLLRGAWYPSFSKPHDGLGFGPEMTTEDHGGTGFAGIAYYAADQFPPRYRDTVFIGNVITCRVNHDSIQWQGSSPRAKREADFLVSDDPWFRPVDIKLGPDGALYVADFYNRVIGHYEVPLDHPKRDRERGRIWRIVYKGAAAPVAKAPRADWTKAAAAELVADLGHPNLTVRLLATHELARREGEAPEAAVRAGLRAAAMVFDSESIARVAHSLWVLERRGRLDSETLAGAAGHGAALVRVHALRILSERLRWTSAERALALAGLTALDPQVRRAAADAVGRHTDASNIPLLLALLHGTPADDTHLRHVARMALRDQFRDPTAWRELRAGSKADRRELLEIALGVASAEAATFVDRQIAGMTDRALRLQAVQQVARYGPAVAGKDLLSRAARDAAGDLAYQAQLFRAVERGTQERGASLSAEALAWATDLAAALLRGKSPDDARVGLELVGALRLQQFQHDVQVYAVSTAAPEPVRHAALSALAALDARRHAGALGKLLSDDNAPFGLRGHVANLLAQANVPETLAELLKAFPVAPARLQTQIATALASSRPGAEQLLAAVEAGKGSARLLLEPPVATRLSRNAPHRKDQIAALTRGLPPADARLRDLLQRRRDRFAEARPDPVLGQKVFTTWCAGCHQLAGQGGARLGNVVGPQLDGIGLRGLERLLEDVLDPNRNVDQAFRVTLLNLKNGKVLTGLLLREEGATLVLADAMGKEFRVNKADVEERHVSTLSLMPDLAERIAEADFHHLMAFLLSQKPGNR